MINKKSCPACDESHWERILIKCDLSYFRCKNCKHEIQAIDQSDRETWFRSQQTKYYGDNSTTLDCPYPSLEKEILRQRTKVTQRFMSTNSSIIEVGPGAGKFGESLIKRGHSLTFVEESITVAEILERTGGKVFVGEFEKLSLETGGWDSFCSFHVIEHVPDILEHLRAGRRAVKHGGVAFIATPSADSLEHRLPFGLSPNYDYAHLSVFSIESLKLCLKKCGWKPVYLSTPEYSISWFRVMTKLLRRMRKEHEGATAGKYANTGSNYIKVLAKIISLVGCPPRTVQSTLKLGNEIFLVAIAE